MTAVYGVFSQARRAEEPSMRDGRTEGKMKEIHHRTMETPFLSVMDFSQLMLQIQFLPLPILPLFSHRKHLKICAGGPLE